MLQIEKKNPNLDDNDEAERTFFKKKVDQYRSIYL